MNSKKKTTLIVGLLAFALILAVLVVTIINSGKKKNDVKATVGIILNGESKEQGWNAMHYDGMKEACKSMNVKLLVKENIRDNTGACPEAIDELVEDGATMIILTSYDYYEESKDTIEKYQDVIFYGSANIYELDNYKGFFIKYYQGRYLTGMLAGSHTKTNKIGYVAAFDNSEVNRGISSFAKGVRDVNPDAEVVVYYIGSWDDEEAEREAVDKLIKDENIDVVTCHQNQNNVDLEADKQGIYSIGYHNQKDKYSEKHLTSVVEDWEITYKEIIKQYLSGELEDKISWLGIDKGAVKLSEYSSEVTKEESDMITDAINRMISGEDVFSGLIYDNEGNIRCNEEERISDEKLLTDFKWLIEGVRVYAH